MQKQAQDNGQDTLSVSLDKDQYKENYSLIERADIEGSPFTLIKIEQGCFIGWGNARLTPYMETFEECTQFMETNKWDLLGAFIAAMMEKRDEYLKQNS